jgi:hypothetical protein
MSENGPLVPQVHIETTVICCKGSRASYGGLLYWAIVSARRGILGGLFFDPALSLLSDSVVLCWDSLKESDSDSLCRPLTSNVLN